MDNRAKESATEHKTKHEIIRYQSSKCRKNRYSQHLDTLPPNHPIRNLVIPKSTVNTRFEHSDRKRPVKSLGSRTKDSANTVKSKSEAIPLGQVKRDLRTIEEIQKELKNKKALKQS